MNQGRARWLLVMTLVLALAFVLRAHRLDSIPLRGDEAFAVRYWASSPADVLDSEWAASEPHPVGTYLSFWAWKSAAGESEFAMRYLPLLGNLLGVAAVVALGRRIFHDNRIALLGALLWAANPFLIWHAQDVRNYALWSGVSPLALWLFLRAADSNRPRDWAWYVVAEVCALYLFFLEAFLLVVQALYLLAVRRSRPVIQRAVMAWLVLGLLLIPWLLQAWWVSGSGYTGTVRDANLPDLLTWFLPVLLTGGELPSPWHTVLPLAWLALVAWGLYRRAWRGMWLAGWILVPTALLLVAATRMSVFHPRYLITVTPALLLMMAAALLPTTRRWQPGNLLPLALLAMPLIGFSTLADYYDDDGDTKSPGWPDLAAYLEARADPSDLIVQVFADPAYGYYLRGGNPEFSLMNGVDVGAQLRPEVAFYDTIWLVGREPQAEAFLAAHMQPISQHSFSDFDVLQYRSWEGVDQPAIACNITFHDGRLGEIVRLTGYTIQGPDDGTRAITVLLYWDLLTPQAVDYNAFVHLLGPPRPDGNILWDQGQDHAPAPGRDVFHLLDDPALELAPGAYTLAIGLYPAADPSADARLSVLDSGDDDLGSSYQLTTITFN
ncbi:MAG: hypothetical protein GYB65_08035 [Chloroflexi bacterium]|nr:hypothetical protein [Chloroflexota bacterium]